MKEVTDKEVSDLRGMELIYLFDDGNGPELSGKSTPAYVAQADRSKGITIMGCIPEGDYPDSCGFTPGKEVILQCCNSHGAPDAEDFVEILSEYITLIKSGVFQRTSADTASKGSAGMHEACAF